MVGHNSPLPLAHDALPYPVAAAWHRVLHQTDEVLRLREVFACEESVLRFLVAISLAQLSRDELDKLKCVGPLERPSLGHWVAALNELADLLETRKECATPQLRAWLRTPVLRAVAEGPAAATAQQVIARLVTARNRFAHSGAPIDPEESRSIEADLASLLQSLEWLSSLLLLEVRNVAPRASGELEAMVVPWRGDRTTPAAHSIRFRGWLVENSLVLVDIATRRVHPVEPWVALATSGRGPRTPLVLRGFRPAQKLLLADDGNGSELSVDWPSASAHPMSLGDVDPLLLVQPTAPPTPPTGAAWATERTGASWPAPRGRTNARRWVAAGALLAGGVTFAAVMFTSATTTGAAMGEWELDSRAFRSGAPTDIGARYHLSLVGDAKAPTATLVRERYIRHGVLDTKRSVGASGPVKLARHQLGGRTWWLGRFVVEGATGREFVRRVALTWHDDALEAVMVTGSDDVPVCLAIGGRRRDDKNVDGWGDYLADAARYPAEVGCVVAEANLGCVLADRLREL